MNDVTRNKASKVLECVAMCNKQKAIISIKWAKAWKFTKYAQNEIEFVVNMDM